MKLCILLLISQGILGMAMAQPVTLDSTFGGSGTGYVQMDNQSGAFYSHMKVMEDDKIIIVGFRPVIFDEVFALQVGRLLPSGEPDTDFSEDGFTFLDQVQFQAPYVFKISIGILPDDQIQVGAFVVDTNGETARYLLTRLHADGSLDSTFGENGFKHFPVIGNGFQYGVLGFEMDANGNTFMIGVEENHQAIWKLDPNGEADSSFGEGGRIVIPFYQDSAWIERGDEIALLPDGGILTSAAVFRDNDHVGFVVTKLLPNGIPDPGFAEAGSFYFAAAYPGTFCAIHLLPDGNYLFNDYLYASSIRVFKLDASGKLVTSFGENGVATVLQVDALYTKDGLLIRPDGSIWIAFRTFSNPGTRNYIQHFHADFTIDTTFGDSGVFEIPAHLDAILMFSMYAQDDKVILSLVSDYMELYLYPTLLRLNVNIKVAVEDNLEFAAEVAIFPNPAVDRLHIEVPADKSLQAVRIVDSAGRVLFESDIDTQHNIQLSLPELTPGMYTLMLQFEEGVVSRQFVHY